MLNDADKNLCLKIAKDTIAFKLGLIDQITPCPDSVIFNAQEHGLFVTLHKNGQLRGCIGYVSPYNTLYKSIIELAEMAAFKDTRFRPVTKEEFPDLDYEISILSKLFPVNDLQEIVVGRDGLIITNQGRSGLLLPQVATQYNWDRETFLKQTCYKAGLHESILSDKKTTVLRFEAEVFS